MTTYTSQTGPDGKSFTVATHGPTVTRADCRAMYLDWVNNFLTVARFAEYYGLDAVTASAVIDEGRALHEWRVDHGITHA